MTACPRLTELTLIYPYPGDPLVSETLGVPLDVVETTQSATSELVDACKSLPEFNTIQIVHYLGELPHPPVTPEYGEMEDDSQPSADKWRQASRDWVNDVKDLAIDCLKKREMGCREGEGRKRTTLRVIKLGRYRLPGKHSRGSVRVELVEEYEVPGYDAEDL